MNSKLLFILLIPVLSACQGNERLIEKAGLEGSVAAEKQVEAENANIKRRSTELESDLTRRQRFFQSVSGTYEGTLQTDQGAFNMRVTLVSSLPPYTADRTRMPDEIVADLTTLAINTQIVQWHPSNSRSATGCRVIGIKPDLNEGALTVASSDCPNFYSIRISDDGAPEEASRSGVQRRWLSDIARSGAISRDILDGKGAAVQQLVGEMKPTTNAEVYYFLLKRVGQ